MQTIKPLIEIMCSTSKKVRNSLLQHYLPKQGSIFLALLPIYIDFLNKSYNIYI